MTTAAAATATAAATYQVRSTDSLFCDFVSLFPLSPFFDHLFSLSPLLSRSHSSGTAWLCLLPMPSTSAFPLPPPTRVICSESYHMDTNLHTTLALNLPNRIDVDAPLYNDPKSPTAQPGPVDGLWDYEVVEVFLLGSEQRYLEVEVRFLGERWIFDHKSH